LPIHIEIGGGIETGSFTENIAESDKSMEVFQNRKL